MAEERYWQIWRNYAALKRQTLVMRMGFAEMGVYPVTSDGKTEPQRSESVAEHVLGTLILLDEVAMFCPELISEVETLRCMRLLLKHEVGESKIGDIPEDGRYNEAQKNNDELQAMMQYSKSLPTRYGPRLLGDFINFQNKSSWLTQVVYCVDKLEAVLQCLLYEQDGREVCVSEESSASLSEQDRAYMRCTGSTRIADNWGAHCLDLIRDFECAPVFRAILRAAVEDVRGEWFAWAED